MRPIIGLVPTAKLFEGEDPFKDQYVFVNNYPKRILENGGLPLGILSADGSLDPEALEPCQGFLLCGGGKIWPYHLQVVGHALQTGKPLLGICLGMQAICAYFRVQEARLRRQCTLDDLELFAALKQERYMFNLPAPGHWEVPITRENGEETKHPVHIQPGTYLHRLLGREEVRGISLHNYQVNGLPLGLTLSALAQDGVIEGIERGNSILGVQFHPEVEREFDCLFADLVEKSRAYGRGGPGDCISPRAAD